MKILPSKSIPGLLSGVAVWLLIDLDMYKKIGINVYRLSVW